MVLESTDIPILISVVAFLATCLFFVGIMQYFRYAKKRRELIEKIRDRDRQEGVMSREDSPLSLKNRAQKAATNFLSIFGKYVTPDDADHSQVRLKFLKAGLRKANIPGIFWGVKGFLTICLPVCFVLIMASASKLSPSTLFMGLCISSALMGLYLPDIWLRIKTDRRKQNIFEGLPDAIDLLVVCVEAGMGLDAAINRVGEEIKLTNRALSDEFKLLNLELRAGKSRKDALRNLAMRIDLEDVNNFVTLLVQADRFGTSIAQTLRVYSDTFRSKRQQRAEEIAAKLPVKLVFPCIIFIFPSLFIAIMGPALIGIYKTLLQ